MQNYKNYSVEDDLDVDFFAALKNLQSSHDHDTTHELMQEEQGTSSNDNPDVCLITDQPLNAFHVVLACGHKFNYEPLYQEVLRQKGRVGMHNYYEKIGTNQIKCPYCRCMTNELLPYIGTNPHPIIKRLVGVNAPATMCMPGTPCSANKCTVNAFYECNENLYCYRHYQIAIKPKLSKSKSTAAATKSSATTTSQRCIAENQTGKNKGKQCRLSAYEGTTLCKIHAKCTIVVGTPPIQSPISTLD